MRSALCRLLPAAVAMLAAIAYTQPPNNPAASRQAELKGVILKVQIKMREGPAALALRTENGAEWNVVLGSLRYLIDHDFNPKAGQKIVVSGYVTAERQLIASRVTLPDVPRTLLLRNEQGRPLWRGGRHGRGEK